MIRKNSLKANNLILNIITYALLQIVNLSIGILLPRIYLKVYGSEVNGVVSTINSFISYFSYLESGLGLAMMNTLYKPLSDRDYKRISQIVSFTKIQYIQISSIYFILVVALSIVFPFISTDTSLGKLEFGALIFVIGIYGAIDFYTMAKYRVLLTADRKEYVISLAMIFAQILRFTAIMFVLKYKPSIIIIKIIPILTLILRAYILRLYVKMKSPHVDFKEKCKPNSIEINKRWDALLLQLSINASTTLPVILVSQLLGYIQANIYSVYYIVISAMISIISAFSSGVAPMLGRLVSNKRDISKIYNYYEWLISIILTMVFSTGVILILPFIRIYTNVISNTEYINVTYAVLFCIWAAIYSYRIPSTAVINASALYKENRKNNIANILLLIMSCWIFTSLWGIKGTLISLILTAIHRNISIIKNNCIYVLNKKLYYPSLLRMAIMVGIILITYYLSTLTPIYLINNMSQWLVTGIIAVIINGVLSLSVFIIADLKTSKELIKMILNKNMNAV